LFGSFHHRADDLSRSFHHHADDLSGSFRRRGGDCPPWGLRGQSVTW
jgi:hypothetical protein